MASRKKIVEALNKISACYPGRVTATQDMINVWIAMLGDLDECTFEAAVVHCCSVQKTWPPDIATIRQQCALLQRGALHSPGPDESWGRVLKLMRGSDVALDATERDALQDIGGLQQIRISQNQTEDRRRFCAAWSARYNKLMATKTTQQIVKRHAIAAAGSLSDRQIVKSLPEPDRYIDDPVKKISEDDFSDIKKQLTAIFDSAAI